MKDALRIALIYVGLEQLPADGLRRFQKWAKELPDDVLLDGGICDRGKG